MVRQKRLSHILAENADKLDLKAGKLMIKRIDLEHSRNEMTFPYQVLLSNGEMVMEFGSDIFESCARLSYCVENRLYGRPKYDPEWIHRR